MMAAVNPRCSSTDIKGLRLEVSLLAASVQYNKTLIQGI